MNSPTAFRGSQTANDLQVIQVWTPAWWIWVEMLLGGLAFAAAGTTFIAFPLLPESTVHKIIRIILLISIGVELFFLSFREARYSAITFTDDSILILTGPTRRVKRIELKHIVAMKGRLSFWSNPRLHLDNGRSVILPVGFLSRVDRELVRNEIIKRLRERKEASDGTTGP